MSLSYFKLFCLRVKVMTFARAHIHILIYALVLIINNLVRRTIHIGALGFSLSFKWLFRDIYLRKYICACTREYVYMYTHVYYYSTRLLFAPLVKLIARLLRSISLSEKLDLFWKELPFASRGRINVMLTKNNNITLY